MHPHSKCSSEMHFHSKIEFHIISKMAIESNPRHIVCISIYHVEICILNIVWVCVSRGHGYNFSKMVHCEWQVMENARLSFARLTRFALNKLKCNHLFGFYVSYSLAIHEDKPEYPGLVVCIQAKINCLSRSSGMNQQRLIKYELFK